ncbi:TonB-dependent receptor plug domain-containing protein [Maribellus comscasis]|uniref:TonB-dependent receptor plug domain-containing protein n=1 Tax=Maribellus comscasis TaxID=2681766 RepID=A0A6I6JQE1_9BACT|nr:TonB-dependent receptor [Maribellus comscasis]QGY45196.1 TonB-dependent receptor plug domain-containing protein [Maribellus comscasis]
MKNIYLLLLLLGLTVSGFSQTITITDNDSGEPLQFVVLISESPKAYATTNKNGQSDITDFKGSEKIDVTFLGYKKVAFTYSDIESRNFSIELEKTNLNIDEVVVSAARWQQSSSSIPLKVITISPAKVSMQNPQTTADLLGISGKVFIQKSQQGGGSPMIRGFATNRLLYSVDGVRMNTAIFRGGNIQNVISVDPFSLENAEVLFGPGSVIYGSDAIGGVMSFQTLTPQLSYSESTLISGKAVARYSSANNERTGHFDVNVGWGKWAFVTSVSSFDYDHLRQGSHGPDEYIKPYHIQRQSETDVVIYQNDQLLQIPTAYSQINMMQKVRFRPTEKFDFQYGFHYSETSPYGRYDRHNRIRNGLPRYAEWNYGPQIWMMNNFSVTHKGDNVLYDQSTLRLAQQAFEESRIDRSLNKSDRTTNTEKVKAYSANFDFVKTTGTKNTLYYGLEYVLNDVESTGEVEDISTTVVEDGPSRYPQATWQSMALYLNDQFKISDQFLLQAGIRYNQFKIDAEFDTRFYPFPFTEANMNKGALTGSIGGVFRPTEDWVISTNLATAFRAPNVDDMGKVFDSEPGAVVVPNPDLDAEYAYSADLGVAKIFGDIVKIDLSAYYTKLNNALVRRDFTLNGLDSIVYDGVMSKVQAIQNAAEANVYGIQAGIEVKLPEGFGLSSDFNYQKGEEELDDGTTSPSRHAAPAFGITKLTYATDLLRLELYAAYQAEYSYNDLAVSEQEKTEIYALDENGNPYSPSWYTLNFKGMYNVNNSLSFSAGIENLTDQRYRPYSSGASAPGRNFFLSLTQKF